MYNINMFGSGIRYWVCEIPMDEFISIQKIRDHFKIEYENIFFDLELLEKIGFSNWENIHCVDKGRGFIIKERNRIEIKRKAKLLKSFDSSELIYSPLLLEQHKIIYDDFNRLKNDDFKLIALIQFEVGSFFRFNCDVENFDVNKLHFVLNYDKIHLSIGEQFVSDLVYDFTKLKQMKEDVVCTGNQVVFL